MIDDNVEKKSDVGKKTVPAKTVTEKAKASHKK
jgi:hypothetical protein